jgi:cell division initiation protein
MAITSEDIQNQSFNIDRKGYDVDEVDVFLEHVADEIDALNARIAELEAQLDGAGDTDDSYAGFETVAMDPVDLAAEEDGLESVEEEDFETSARIADLERQLSEKKANDKAIAQALVIAQRTADETIAKADDEADAIVADARAEASRIIADANADKQEILDEMRKLDEDCEEMRGRFQTVLKDFISDATTKLADISDASIMASAHARSNKSQPRGDSPAYQAASNYVTPVFSADNTVAAPATPTAYANDRDLSGYGDAAVNDLEFDDLD